MYKKSYFLLYDKTGKNTNISQIIFLFFLESLLYPRFSDNLTSVYQSDSRDEASFGKPVSKENVPWQIITISSPSEEAVCMLNQSPAPPREQ